MKHLPAVIIILMLLPSCMGPIELGDAKLYEADNSDITALIETTKEIEQQNTHDDTEKREEVTNDTMEMKSLPARSENLPIYMLKYQSGVVSTQEILAPSISFFDSALTELIECRFGVLLCISDVLIAEGAMNQLQYQLYDTSSGSIIMEDFPFAYYTLYLLDNGKIAVFETGRGIELYELDGRKSSVQLEFDPGHLYWFLNNYSAQQYPWALSYNEANDTYVMVYHRSPFMDMDKEDLAALRNREENGEKNDICVAVFDHQGKLIDDFVLEGLGYPLSEKRYSPQYLIHYLSEDSILFHEASRAMTLGDLPCEAVYIDLSNHTFAPVEKEREVIEGLGYIEGGLSYTYSYFPEPLPCNLILASTENGIEVYEQDNSSKPIAALAENCEIIGYHTDADGTSLIFYTENEPTGNNEE